MAKIAILGYGTVGSGVAHVLDENVNEVKRSAGEEVSLKAILDLREFPGDAHEALVTHDFNAILDDPDISVVCETMGGVNPAYDFTKKALEAGKSVCTSNKELVAKHGPELVKTAKEHGASYLFEASVGGGIPILRTLEGALKSERIDEITGILNGTTNYILTELENSVFFDKAGAVGFDEVLKKAQELGYAERDPSADIEGHDACRKIAILGSLMTGSHVDPAQVPTEGITKITADDLIYAHAFCGTVKLLGSCKFEGGALEIMVAPFIVADEHPLASVKGVYNAIAVHGNMLGTSMYYGQGAGRDATASAVVADVCEMVRNSGRTVPVSMGEEEAKTADTGNARRRFYLRVSEEQADEIRKSFPGSVLKTAGEWEASEGTAAIMTDYIRERDFLEKTADLDGIQNWLRVLN